MIKIAHKREEGLLKHLPIEVAVTAVEIAIILDDNYGEQRNVDYDLGGCVLIVEGEKDVGEIRKKIELRDNIPEYIDIIKCSNGESYTRSLILLSSDYSISLMIPLNLTPKDLLMHMEE